MSRRSKSVVSWLVHASADIKLFSCTGFKTNSIEPSSTDDTLHHVFSASHQFMETLRCLKSGYAGRTQTNLNEGTSSHSRTDHSSPLTSTQGIPLASLVLVIHTPVLLSAIWCSCHTLLLEIYVSVFGSLQRDVDHCLDSDPVGQDPAVGTASLGDMPLVLIVQLCSYNFDRQHRAASSYLSPKLEPGQREQIDVSGSPESMAIQGVNSEPGSEVQRRLERLQQSLRI
jgi:hypothetical protein